MTAHAERSAGNGCRCIELTNEALAEQGSSAMVDTALIWNQQSDTTMVRIALRCVKTNSRDRKRAPVLIAQFCPLCGTPYAALTAARVPDEREVQDGE